MSTLTQSPAWQALQVHQPLIAQQHLRTLFANDPQRFEQFSVTFNDILLDYSKQPVTTETMRLLLALARQQGLASWITRLFEGDKINSTEQRAALHIALRADQPVWLDGVDVLPEVKRVLQQMEHFTTAVHRGEQKGYTGLHFTDIVNIGIGGSDLGPMMVTEALKPYAIAHLTPHFVSNVDGAHLAETLKPLNPATTLFIIASKTFTTQETLANAHSAREWFLAQGGTENDIASHFVAVSTNREAVQTFGIDPSNMFEFWDWVGGRYSLWSAIGLPIALAIGMENFYALLAGARAMDQHFLSAPLEKNLPVILGLIGIWQINFFRAGSHAILPYDQHLHRFPAYLQQLEMESNGKRITRDGEEVDYDTGTVVWGEPGTNGQHAFYQLLHQGTPIVTADFLAPCQSHHVIGQHHRLLLANFFAQTEALMRGKNADEVRAELTTQDISPAKLEKLLPHRIFPGNRATTSILFKKLDPATLGTLIALYEHKVFVQSVIWNINPFDQWGVELGKQLAGRILNELAEEQKITSHDASTNGLMAYFKSNQK
ncbi:glucose-6-phosphate isomerase [Nitrosomonas nitrosa]|uniref:glucose-6-phosphate isomerase n=1 Tax=Nitrosomonas nitrosa TaxID=52442 RepID=UPI0023F9179F|nr:glucose-6-phosphate isomerase [Nitrosomonas nitrosa]MCO6435071.1 glucose-6-phosphate isomerase [Nitrosomonas nitrosa]